MRKQKKMVEAGMTIEKIAKARNLSIGTVVSHIEKIKLNGEEINLEHLKLSQERLEKIRSAFLQSGGTLLSPVRDILGKEYSYEELRVARLFL